jgi:hemin uptake protein HemP
MTSSNQYKPQRSSGAPGIQGPGSPRTQQPPARRTSRELFGDGERLLIEHRGDEYLLRITRNGKLILTK